MSDQRDGGTEARLRALERRAQETRAPADHYAFRLACLSLGQAARAGLEVGDRVSWEVPVFRACSSCGGSGGGPRDGRHDFCPHCHGNGGDYPTTTGRGGRLVEIGAGRGGGFRVWPFAFVNHGSERDGVVALEWKGEVRLVEPRDPTRARRPAKRVDYKPSPSASWRERLAPHVHRVLSLTEAHGASEEEIRTSLQRCYSTLLGPRENHPYKAWCAEVRAQRGLEPHPKKAKAERLAAASRPVPLFEGGAR